MAYEPRLSTPDTNSKWWTVTSAGGVNKCPAVTGNSVLPSNTGYAWGRFSEILGAPCKLPTSYAETWWTLTSGYERGQVPKVGAVAVWKQKTGDGHVGIVEQVNETSILVSNSAGGGVTFYVSEHRKANNYAIDPSTALLGFIYNPNADEGDPRHDFVTTAMSYIKNPKAGEIAWKRSGLTVGGSWNAAFVVGVATEVGGLIDRVIYRTSGSGELIRSGVKSRLGMWIEGPFWGKSVTPMEGDIVALRTRNRSNYTGQDRYTCDKVGIVQKLNDKKLTAIFGDWANECRDIELSLDNKQISGYYRPMWATIGGSTTKSSLQSSVVMTSKGQMTQTSQIFTNYTPDDGAILREVCYITKDGEPSINTTDMKLCVINCIGKIAELTGGATDLSTSSAVNMDRMTNQNAKTILQFLLDSCKLNAAQAIGILANIQAESNFSTSATNISSGASGICQWLGDRKTSMISMCGGPSSWRDNLTGQLKFLWHELTTGYQHVLNKLNTNVIQLTESAAQTSAEIFCRNYEIPENMAQNVLTRRGYASQLWSQITLIPTSGSVMNNNSNGVVRNRAGNILSNGTRINIPANVDQGGIIPNYTNYGYFYGRWNKSTVQYQLSEIWASQGKPSSRGIATIDSYYLIAVSPKIGKCGDIITVVLEDGASFNAIIGDEKGTDAQTDWGHIVSGHVDIVEWEKAGRSDNHVDNDTKIDLTGWAKKKVAYCINYGAYI